jgi:transcriptional regulator with XRE-family HTH domain
MQAELIPIGWWSDELMTEDEFVHVLGVRVQKARLAARLDDGVLEKHGISKQLLTTIEQGVGDYSILDLKALAELLGSNLSELTEP